MSLSPKSPHIQGPSKEEAVKILNLTVTEVKEGSKDYSASLTNAFTGTKNSSALSKNTSIGGSKNVSLSGSNKTTVTGSKNVSLSGSNKMTVRGSNKKTVAGFKKTTVSAFKNAATSAGSIELALAIAPLVPALEGKVPAIPQSHY